MSRKTGQSSKGRRRGSVFPVRVTDDERSQLEALQARGEGPRALGPWLIWRALDGEPPPRRRGNTGPRPGITPSSCAGITSAIAHAGAVLPARASALGAEVLPGRAGYYQDLAGAGITAAVNAEARAGITAPACAARVVLDLCGGSGSWSAPYVAAGYDVQLVTLPDLDVRTYVPPPDVWGVLAAPPCTEFSLAKNGHPRDFAKGMECVNACLRIIWQARPRWWALENPTGYLGEFLGTPADVWEPCDFGDPWTKRTALWGEFQLPRRGPFVEPTGSAMDRPTPDARAITPPGFARAFFEANQ